MLTPVRLTCEHLVDPLGLDEPEPRFGWALEGEGRDRRQTRFELRIATCVDRLAGTDGLVRHLERHDDDTVDVVPAGKPLRPRTRYWWTVRAWDETGRPGPFAAPASFETGLMGEPWSARWIAGPPPPRRLLPPPGDRAYRNRYRALPVAHLRRAFRLADRPARARLYATALGVYAARLNGVAVGDALLAPGWTDYATRLDVQTYDVTDLVVAGENVLGLLLGEGWYSGYLGFYPHRPRRIYGKTPQVLAMLIVTFADGTEDLIGTDETWRVARGPRILSDLLKGEVYDARLARPGWDRAGYDDDGWPPAPSGRGTGALLRGQRAPLVRVTRELAPVAVTRTPDGDWVFDMGQNMVGRCRVAVGRLAPGSRIALRHAEMLEPDGTLYLANLRSARAEDVYVAAEAGETEWEPLFTVHGFRYVAVTGLDREPALDVLTGRVVNSDLPETARFETSNPLLDRLWSNILWSQRGNVLSVPTDCPQRDERLGWTADVQVFLPTAAINMDMRAFMAKWVDDLLDAQSADGAFPDVAPRAPHGPDGAPGWGDAGVIVPVTLHRIYDDRRLLARAYPAMRRWVEHIARHNPSHIRTKACGWNFGDWLAPGETTPKPLVATAYWALVLQCMQDAAVALAEEGDRQAYAAAFERVAAAFRARFLAEDGTLEGDTQTGALLALSAGLLPPERQRDTVRRLVANIEGRGTHLATGFLGVRLILPELTRHGHAELAYRLTLQTSRPSWAYPITRGATTLWERWDGWTDEKGFQSARMNSFNHCALGAVGEWVMATVGGIAQAPGSRCFGHLDLAPVPGPGVDRCQASLVTPRGTVESAWRRGRDGTRYVVALPPNTRGTLTLPCPAGGGVLRDGAPAEPDAITTRHGLRCAVFELGSGRHAVTVVEPDGELV